MTAKTSAKRSALRIDECERNPGLVIEIDAWGRVTYANQVSFARFPDLSKQGASHPFLDGLRVIAANLCDGETDSASREVKVGDLWFLQIIHRLPSTGNIRVYGIDLTQHKHADEAIHVAREQLQEQAEELRVQAEELRAQTEELTKEISERELAEKALTAERENFRNSMEKSPVGIQIITFEGEIVYVNRTMLDLWDYGSLEELRKVPLAQRYGPETVVMIGKLNDQRRQGKVPAPYEVTMVCKNGRHRTLRAQNKEIVWNGQRCAEVLYEDITERRQIEARLFEISSHQETILAAVPDMIMEVDNNKVYKWANAAGIDFFGDDVIGKEAAHYFVGEQETYKMVQPVFEGADATTYVESWQRRKDEAKRLLAWWCRPLKDKQGKVVGALSIAQDITERRKAEEALAAEKENFHNSMETSPFGVQVVTFQGELIYSNRTMLNMWGYGSFSELKSTPREQRFTPDSVVTINENEELLNRRTVPPSYEATIICKGGGTRQLEAHPKQIIWNGEVCVQILYGDVTERKKAEQTLRFSDTAFRAIHDAVMAMDNNFVVTYWNDTCEKMFGVKASDAIGKYIGDVVARVEEYPGQKKLALNVLKDSGHNAEEQLWRSPRGDVWVDVRAQGLESNGKRVGWVTLAADITERKRAERALRESERKYRDLVDNAAAGIVLTTLDGHVIEVNETLARMHGYASKEEFAQSPISQRYHDIKDRERWVALAQKTGKVDGYEIEVRRKDGSLFWTSITSILRTAETGEQQLITVSQDITERKQTENRLLQSERKYSTLVEQGTDLIAIIQDGQVKFVNSKITEMAGFTSDEVLGHPFIDFVAPACRALAADIYRKRMSGQLAPNRYEIELVAKDGKKIPVETSGGTIEYEGRPADMVAIRDITERKRSEEVLRQSEEKLRLMFQSVAEGIVLVDLNGVNTDVNQRMLDMHGLHSREEMVGKGVLEFVAPEDREKVIESMKKTNEDGSIDKLEVKALRANGETFLAEVSAGTIKDSSGKPIGTVATLRDITETKRMQEQLLAQDRLASIGELVSGVAHEINNPLTGVIGFSQLLMERDLADDVREELSIISGEAQRAARIVKNLLTFARKHAPVKQNCQINSIIEDVLKLRAYEQQVSNIKVVRRLAEDLPEIMADYYQLQQLFLNIVINAEFFMVEAHHQGTLTITTEKVDRHVRVSIDDDGPGIPQENLMRIFDPFFTTKPVGKGTGLGLSICHGIVTEHGGTIRAESDHGKGATFIVDLPIDSPATE